MMLTEEEAKSKWCPFARHLAVFRQKDGREHAASYNRGAQDSGLGSARCIASACMAWRWESRRCAGVVRPDRTMWIEAGEQYAIEPTRPVYVTTDWKWDARRGVWVVGCDLVERGYCGLAGHQEGT